MKFFRSYVNIMFQCLIYTAFAQVAPQSATRLPDNHIATVNQMNDLFNIAESTIDDYMDIEGSPYFDNTYNKATLINEEGDILGDLPLRYNAFKDEMETPMKNGDIGALSKVDFITIHLNNKKYVVIEYSLNNGTIEKGYFVEIEIGTKCNLYSRSYKTLQEAQEAKSTFHPPTPAKFLEHDDLYLKFPDKEPQKIKLAKKKVLNSFDDQFAPLLKTYVKDKKLDLSKLEALITLLRYYNQMD